MIISRQEIMRQRDSALLESETVKRQADEQRARQVEISAASEAAVAISSAAEVRALAAAELESALNKAEEESGRRLVEAVEAAQLSARREGSRLALVCDAEKKRAKELSDANLELVTSRATTAAAQASAVLRRQHAAEMGRVRELAEAKLAAQAAALFPSRLYSVP